MTGRETNSLNPNVRGLGQSATLAIKDRCKQLRRAGRTVFDFGLGQSPFPVPMPVVEALRLAATTKDYLPVKGLPALREAVAESHRIRDDVDAHADRVIIGPGSKELMFLLQLVYKGEILVPTPCWVSYVPQARIIGRKVTPIPTTFEERWKITPERLARVIETGGGEFRPRVLILNYPGNPTGDSYTASELEDLAAVARRNRVIVLSDEIYGRLHHAGKHVSIGRFYPEGSIISSGLSKWCGAGGWRLGTFVFPPDLDWLADALAAVASETYTSVSAPIQYAAVRAFEGGVEIEVYLGHARRILALLARRSTEMLNNAGIRTHRPTGGFYLFLDFSPLGEQLASHGIHDDATLCSRLMDEAGIAILPGSAFTLSQNALTARLAYVDFHGARALAASEKIPLGRDLPEDFADRYCKSVIRGVDRITKWVHQDMRPRRVARQEDLLRRGRQPLGQKAGGVGACTLDLPHPLP